MRRFIGILMSVVLLLAFSSCNMMMGTDGSSSGSGGSDETTVEDPPVEDLPFEEPSLVESLESYLTFENGSDDISSDNDGTIYGATTTEDRFGQALVFDGENDYVEIPHSDSVNFGVGDKEDYSVSVWVHPFNLDSDGDGYQHIISKLGTADTEGDNGPSPFELFTSVDRVAYYVKDGTGSGTAAAYNTGETTISANEWQHFVLVKEGDYFSIYKNGVRVSYEHVVIDSSIANNQPITIGQRGDDKIYFDGMIDEVGLFNKALTSDEIVALYTSYPEPTDVYPTIEWADAPDDGFSISTSSVVTTHHDKYDEAYKGLDFSANYNTESVDFGFALTLEETGPLYIFAMPIDSNGNNAIDDAEKGQGVFNNHTVEVDVIYQSEGIDNMYSYTYHLDDGIYYDNISDVSTYGISNIDYMDIDGDGEFLDLDAYPNSGDYTLAVFKEIRFIAIDGTTYYTWTNPDL